MDVVLGVVDAEIEKAQRSRDHVAAGNGDAGYMDHWLMACKQIRRHLLDELFPREPVPPKPPHPTVVALGCICKELAPEVCIIHKPDARRPWLAAIALAIGRHQ